MLTTVLKFCNENHWYIIAGIFLSGLFFWGYGCESEVCSLINPDQKVNRLELENEVRYIVGKADALKVDLDKQDAIKQQLLDAANVIGSGGNINPSGLLNLVASIGGISFGLSQRQKYNAVKKTTTAGSPAAAISNPSG